MRRFLALSAAFIVGTSVHTVLACEGTRVDEPVVVRSQAEVLLAQANQLEILASSDVVAATTADQEAARLSQKAQRLRVEARSDGLARAELLAAADQLEVRAGVSRSRAGHLRTRAATRRAQASELRARARGQIVVRWPNQTSRS
jgi:hypothetical protein